MRSYLRDSLQNFGADPDRDEAVVRVGRVQTQHAAGEVDRRAGELLLVQHQKLGAGTDLDRAHTHCASPITSNTVDEPLRSSVPVTATSTSSGATTWLVTGSTSENWMVAPFCANVPPCSVPDTNSVPAWALNSPPRLTSPVSSNTASVPFSTTPPTVSVSLRMMVSVPEELPIVAVSAAVGAVRTRAKVRAWPSFRWCSTMSASPFLGQSCSNYCDTRSKMSRCPCLVRTINSRLRHVVSIVPRPFATVAASVGPAAASVRYSDLRRDTGGNRDKPGIGALLTSFPMALTNRRKSNADSHTRHGAADGDHRILSAAACGSTSA